MTVCVPLSINGPNLNSSSEPRCASGPHRLCYSLSAMRTIKTKKNLEINPSVSESSPSRSHSHLHAVSRQPGKPWVITREILIAAFFFGSCSVPLSSLPFSPNLSVLLKKISSQFHFPLIVCECRTRSQKSLFSTFTFRLRAAVVCLPLSLTAGLWKTWTS